MGIQTLLLFCHYEMLLNAILDFCCALWTLSWYKEPSFIGWMGGQFFEIANTWILEKSQFHALLPNTH